jgi:hypothetical protein
MLVHNTDYESKDHFHDFKWLNDIFSILTSLNLLLQGQIIKKFSVEEKIREFPQKIKLLWNGWSPRFWLIFDTKWFSPLVEERSQWHIIQRI